MSDTDIQHITSQLDALTQRVAAQPQWSRAWDIAMKAVIPVVIAIVGWGIGHEIRMSNLELTTMTKGEAHQLENRMMRALPPDWLREDIKEIKQLLKDQDHRLRALEARVK